MIHRRFHRCPSRAATLLAAAACLASALTSTMPAPVVAQGATRTLVVSTDLGVDDLVALAWLADEPSLEIPAILVAGTGQAECATAVDNLRAVLAALDATGPELGCGSVTPIGGGTPFPADARAEAAALHGLALPPAVDAGTPWRPAEEILGALLDDAYDPMSILSMAPLTSLASVLVDPDRAVKVASVVASMGALDGPGDVIAEGATAPGRAEWNAHADPQAAEAVLQSGAPVTVVTLEAATAAAISQTLVDALLAGGETASAGLVAALAEARPGVIAAGGVLPDAVAAVALAAPDILTSRERYIDVQLAGPDAGALTETEAGFPTQIAGTADQAGFEAALLSGIRTDGGTTTQQPAGTVAITGGATTCDLDDGGTMTPGLAIVTARSTDEPMVAVLAGLAEGYGVAELESFLVTASPTEDAPDWLLLAAYLEVEAGATTDDTAELTPGAYAAICITGDEATPMYLVAPQVLTVTE